MYVCFHYGNYIWSVSFTFVYTRVHCKNWGVKMTPVSVNRGPHPQVLKLHPRV